MEPQHWVLLVLGLLVVGGIAVALVLSAKARAGTLLAAADMVDQWHKRDVAAKQAKLAKLNEDADANAEHIENLEQKLGTKRVKLEAKYVDTGATADEVIERLRRLGL